MNIPPLSPDPIRAVTMERLRLLAIAYKITGIIGAVFISFLLIHATLFTVMSFIPESTWNTKEKTVKQQSASEAPEIVAHQETRKSESPFWFFRILGIGMFLIVLVGWILGGLTFYAGKCIENREKKLFVMIMAGWKCIWIPYGTLLGISTFLVLGATDAKDEYKD